MRIKSRNISSRCELSGASKSFSKSATVAGLLLVLFLGFRLKGLENLDKHLDEVDIIEDELEAVEDPSVLEVVEPPKRRACKKDCVILYFFFQI